MSTYLNRPWQVVHAEDMAAAASHPAAVFSDGTFAVFVKLAEGDSSWDRTACELAGLAALTQLAGVLTPPAVGAIPVGDGAEGAALLVLEAVVPIPRGRPEWRAMGRTLARIHSVKGEEYGFPTHNYWGSLRQDNTPHADWIDYYLERRLAPRLKAAVDGGHLPPPIAARVERLAARLADPSSRLAGPPMPPTLLHGDAHHNNFISTVEGPYLIDPAVYYGHPEMDLAYIDFFAPVPGVFFEGYQEIAPIDGGFTARRDLWRLPAWLGLVEVGGPEYLAGLLGALRPYA